MEREFGKGKGNGGKQEKEKWPVKNDKPEPESRRRLTDIFRKWHPQRVRKPR